MTKGGNAHSAETFQKEKPDILALAVSGQDLSHAARCGSSFSLVLSKKQNTNICENTYSGDGL